MSDHSITQWIQQVKNGDASDAQRRLWNEYFPQLVALAERKLKGVRKGMGDGEDVAISALDSFFSGAPNGEFPLLVDRTNLWPLLATITIRKAINLREKAFTLKEGGGKVRGESAFRKPGDESGLGGFQQVAGDEPTPDFVAEMGEACDRLLGILTEKLRFIAEQRLQGYSCREIADQLGRSKKAVERYVEEIRKLWKEHGLCSM